MIGRLRSGKHADSALLDGDRLDESRKGTIPVVVACPNEGMRQRQRAMMKNKLVYLVKGRTL